MLGRTDLEPHTLGRDVRVRAPARNVLDLARERDNTCVLGALEREQNGADASTGLDGPIALAHCGVDEPKHLIGERKGDLAVAGTVQAGLGGEQVGKLHGGMIGGMITRLRARVILSFAALLDLLSRWSRRRIGLALVYHRIGDPQEDRKGHLVAALGTELFEAQLRQLKRRYRLVPAEDLASAVAARRRGQRLPIAITFDDDLRSHIRTAMPILRRVGVPAAFFLSGRSLSGPFAFWWERLQLAFDRSLLDADELRVWTGTGSPSGAAPDIRTVARAIEAMPRARREQVAVDLVERLGGDPPDSGLRTEDVRGLVAAGFEIGFHTLRHDALPPLDDETLKRALEDGRAELASLVGPPTMISYPHGKADARVAAAAREAGYRFGFTNEPEPLAMGTDPLLIGRLYPIYDSLGRFAVIVSRTLRKGSTQRNRLGRRRAAVTIAPVIVLLR